MRSEKSVPIPENELREVMKMFLCFLYQERFCEPVILLSSERKTEISV